MISSSHVKANFAANRELITRFEKKIDPSSASVWGEGTPTEPEPRRLEDAAELASKCLAFFKRAKGVRALRIFRQVA